MSKSTLEHRTWKQIYQISSYLFQETLQESVLQRVGTNQPRALERLGSGKKAAARQSYVGAAMRSFYYIAIMSFPIEAFVRMKAEATAGLASQWTIFAGSLSIGMFFVISVAYTLLFGVMQSSVLVSADALKFLATLPISDRDLQKVVMLAFFRNVEIQLVVSLLVFPIGVAIVSESAIVTLLSAGVALVIVVLAFSVLILVGERVSRVLHNNDVNTRGASVVRMATMLGLSLGGILLLFSFQFVIRGIGSYFTAPSISPQAVDVLNTVASLIPFPFGGNYIVTELFLGGQGVSMDLWLSSAIGAALLVLVTIVLFRKALSTLRNIIHFEQKHFSTSARGRAKPVAIEAVSPTLAFFKKDLSTASRDFQAVMFVVFPLIIPVTLTIFLTILTGSGPAAFSFVVRLGLSLLFQLLGAVMIIYGFLSMETLGGSVLASLPVVVRHQALPKLAIVMMITPVAAFIPFLFALGNVNLFEDIAVLVISLPVGPLFGLVAMELKVRLFGKLKYQYTLEEFNSEYKYAKWLVIIAVEVGVLLGLLGTAMLLGADIAALVIACLLEEGVAYVVVWVVFNRLFPVPGRFPVLPLRNERVPAP
jgi:hypothetical protein